MSDDPLLERLQPEVPVRLVEYRATPGETGLVIVDEAIGSCTVAAGNLAPGAPDPQITRMVAETARLARRFVECRWPVLVFVDAHKLGKPQPPYPLDCEQGSGEEELEWLEEEADATVLRKDCINDFIGAIEPVHHGAHGTSRNRVVDWVNAHRLKAVVVTGICTDVCVMDFMVTMLSARNHGMTPTLEDEVVMEPATTTYHLPREIVRSLDLPETASHPKLVTHYMGLYLMASRGAVLAKRMTGLWSLEQETAAISERQLGVGKIDGTPKGGVLTVRLPAMAEAQAPPNEVEAS